MPSRVALVLELDGGYELRAGPGHPSSGLGNRVTGKGTNQIEDEHLGTTLLADPEGAIASRGGPRVMKRARYKDGRIGTVMRYHLQSKRAHADVFLIPK